MSVEAFEKALAKPECQVLERLATPGEIQAFLDSTPSSTNPFYRCAFCVSALLIASMAPCLPPPCRGASGTRR